MVKKIGIIVIPIFFLLIFAGKKGVCAEAGLKPRV